MRWRRRCGPAVARVRHRGRAGSRSLRRRWGSNFGTRRACRIRLVGLRGLAFAVIPRDWIPRPFGLEGLGRGRPWARPAVKRLAECDQAAASFALRCVEVAAEDLRDGVWWLERAP